jgi:hypothetical protein
MSENRPKDAERPASLVTLRDQRERAIARLSDAFAQDHLELEEFERRLGIAHRTDSIAELAILTQDLVAQDTEPAPAATKALVPGRQKEQQTLAAIIGGTSRKGHWTPPRRLRVSGVAVWGGVHIETRLPGETEEDAHTRRRSQRALQKAQRRALPPRRDP